MRDPNNLEVVELSLQLAGMTYRVTRGFPHEERFGLVSQMRRAAVSVGSNISEGCGRSTDNAFLSYLDNALGSVCELAFQTLVAVNLEMGDMAALNELRETARRLCQMLSRLRSAVRRKKTVVRSDVSRGRPVRAPQPPAR